MKNIYTLILSLFIYISGSYAQPGIIHTIAGTGMAGFSGDSSLATNAQINLANDLAIDAAGNLYIADASNNRIRKIDAVTGIINTIAGNSTQSYSGDGGLAINAGLHNPVGLAIDAFGNLFISDNGNDCIRKINASTGIITTVAGNHIAGFAGDGGPATAASLNQPGGIAIDATGNLYIADVHNNVIRKVLISTGIIYTIAGFNTYISGFSGDGGPATNAKLNWPRSIAIDGDGNIYIADQYNNRIRKVMVATGIITTVAGGGTTLGDGGPAINGKLNGPTGIFFDVAGNLYIDDEFNNRIRKISATTGYISTVAGTGVSGANGDGGLAINAQLQDPIGITMDAFGSLYISDTYNQLIRKVDGIILPNYQTDSFMVTINPVCSGPQFNILPKHYSPNYHIKTSYGDGLKSDNSFSVYNNTASFNHTYAYPGVYTIKHILCLGNTSIDSITYNYTYTFCRSLPIRLFNDANSNCAFDSTSESLLHYPITLEVDLNGVTIDTITTISGLDYSANGNAGDVYQFKVIANPPGLVPNCPASGIITDTLVVGNNKTKMLGFHCNGATGFDLIEYVSMQTGRHQQHAHIEIANTYCTPQNGVLTVNFSPQYVFNGAYPTPTSVSGNTLTWNLNGIASTNAIPISVDYDLSVPNPGNQSTWISPGDTIHTTIDITPIVGDANPANNHCIRVDTVKSSFDPNYINVAPEGNVLAGAQLQYTIHFENTGNDTAQNISILDTLSANLDENSVAIVSSSNTVITSKTWNGSNWVLKLDFPNIKLLDSSHHNQCDGIVVFNIKALLGVTMYSTIYNHAGIFFDDNPVVMTDTVLNIVIFPVVPTIAISGTNTCIGIPVTFTAVGVNGGTAPIYQWKKNGVDVGTNSPSYTYIPASGDSLVCVFTSNAPFPIPAVVTSNAIHIAPIIISGVTTVDPTTCGSTSGSITLHGLISSTIYTLQYTKNGLPIGPVNFTSDTAGTILLSGLTAAAYSGIVIVTGGCNTTPINNIIVANPTPPIAPTVGNVLLSVCLGDTIHLAASSPVSGAIYSWSGPMTFNSSLSHPFIASAQSTNAGVYSVFVTDPVTNCASLITTSTVSINNNITPSISISGNDTLCAGSITVLTATANISSCTYQWHVNSTNVGSNSNSYSYSPTNGDIISCTINTTGTSSCYTTTNANSNTLSIDVMATIIPTISISGNDTVISGTPTLYTATANINGGTYQWKVNGSNVGANSSTYTYTPAPGDSITCAILVPSIGCFSTTSASSNSIQIVITSLGVNTITGTSGLHVYPNPAINILHIDNVVGNTLCRIMNMMGATLQQSELQMHNNTISIDGLASGIYMLELTNANGEKQALRVVKE
ncbi:MAG: T9SS type A sorting domain-containing protein [Bacteroidota bacterium]